MARETSDPISDQIKRLQRPQRGRRWLSWLLFVGVLTGFLILPVTGSDHGRQLVSWLNRIPMLNALLAPRIAQTSAHMVALRPDPAAALPPGRLNPHGASDRLPPPTVMGFDRSWNPGPLAASHERWALDCKLCHSNPFVPVRDADCLSCHRTIGEHLEAAQHAVHGLSDQRCASCHRDHRGVFALNNQNRHFLGEACAECHGAIKTALPDSATEDVSDFASRHPPFRIQLRSGAGDPVLQRVRMHPGQILSEPTNLKFTHDQHLSAKGIDSPLGKVHMACVDCHRPAPDGLGFERVTMDDHCQSCHQLKLDGSAPNRTLPHGSVADVLSMLREFYAYVGTRTPVAPDTSALGGRLGLARPGAAQRTPPPTALASGDAKGRATAAAFEVFEKTSCVVCHEVSRRDGPGKAGTPGADLPQWSIARIDPPHRWMPQSVFNHRAHANQACGDCHAAATSSKAADVLMPEITVCHDCHAGAQPVTDRVTSDCGLCHGFHLPARLPVPTTIAPTEFQRIRADASGGE